MAGWKPQEIKVEESKKEETESMEIKKNIVEPEKEKIMALDDLSFKRKKKVL